MSYRSLTEWESGYLVAHPHRYTPPSTRCMLPIDISLDQAREYAADKALHTALKIYYAGIVRRLEGR